MKTTIKTILLLFVALGMHAELNAQGIKLPQASSGQTIVQDLGLGKITLTYSRPNVKGRKIFGTLEPYNKVWRTGANSATVIKFTDAVKIEGKDVPAGEYGLFTIPNKTEWTVILNKTSKQWGAYDYKESDDILRIKVKPMVMKDKVETFAMQFTNVLPTSAKLNIMWENTVIAVKITTSIDEQVMASIDAAMKTDKKPYVGAAQYYLDNGKDLATALSWMNEAEKTSPKVPYIKLWKAKVQLKMGDIKGAQATAQAGVDLAAANKDDEYVRLNKMVLDEIKNRQTKPKGK